ADGPLRRGEGNRAGRALPRLRRILLRHRHRVPGRRRDHRRLRHAGMKKQRVVSPVDGSVYAERNLASASQLDKCLSKASAAQRAWRHASVAERVSVVRKMIAWCVERADKLGEELAWQ